LASSVLAPALDEATMRPPIARRARGGRHLLRLLAAAGLPADAAAVFLTHFPLALDDAARAALDDADLRFFRTVAGRVPDGDAVAAALGPLLATATAQLPADFGIPAGRLAAASDACRRWLAWYATFAHRSASPAWQPEQLAYRYDIRVATAGRDTVLSAPHDTDGAVRWYDVDAAPGDAAQRTAVSIVSTTLPARVRYRGMPARRYWELEDAAVHWPSIDAGPGDIGRILFVEFGLTFAEHWLSVPLDVPAGSLTRVTSLVVTDTFGVRTLVSAAVDLDQLRGSTAWRFLELSRTGAVSGPLLFLPPAAVSLDGPIEEAIDVVRDDVGDVVWAIDRTALGADGKPRTLSTSPGASPGASGTPAVAAAPVYRLGPSVDSSYHPYRQQLASDGAALTLLAIPGAPVAVRADLPARLRAHALPSRPLRVAIQPALARSPDGAYHVVHRRVRSDAPASSTPALAFDVVEEAP
ncbi:MAG TPA: hypothetical protein VN253_11200, partial [Kofleriaceae bacterium]|nr:hypothetical protein [Kofleriaceae bacterium]